MFRFRFAFFGLVTLVLGTVDAGADIRTQAPETQESELEQYGVRDPGSPEAIAESERLYQAYLSRKPVEEWPIWPDLSPSTLAWFAAIIILALNFRTRPLISLRNLDTLVLVAIGIALAARFETATPAWLNGHSVQWLAYVLLGVATAYWLIRGLGLALGPREIPRVHVSVSSSAMLVFLLVGMAICVREIATAPISIGSRDGVVGGLALLDTGKHAYGQAPGYETRSPALYGLHAAVMFAIPPRVINDAGIIVPARWDQRKTWLTEDWVSNAQLAAARATNALLFMLMLVGLYLCGARLHSAGVGLTMVAVFTVFPGTLECLARPEIMLPATLLTWATYLALLPGMFSFFSMLLLCLAGISWPWAWFAMPVFLASFIRRGALSAIAASAALVGAFALAAFALTTLVQPAAPRADGALRAAGVMPKFELVQVEETWRLRPVAPPTTQVAGGVTSGLWRFLLNRDEARYAGSTKSGVRLFELDQSAGQSIDGEPFLFRETRFASPDSPVSSQYTPADGEFSTRLAAGLRTVLEAVWLPAAAPADPVPPATVVWLAGASQTSADTIRFWSKSAAALACIVVGMFLLLGQRNGPHHLIGGIAFASAAGLLASGIGPATNWVWLMPAVLALTAVHLEPPGVLRKPIASPGGAAGGAAGVGITPSAASGRLGPAPRITVQE